MNYGDWFNNAAAKRCADMGIRTAERQQVPLLSHNSRVAQKRVSARRATQKVARLNGGERPSTLDPLELRLKLRHKQTGIAVEADDVTAVQSELRERMIEADIDTIIEYLEDYGDPVRALAAIVEKAAGYYEEAQARY